MAKFLISIVLAASIVMVSCDKKENFKKAKILSIDYSLSPCSGGMIIQIPEDGMMFVHQWDYAGNKFGIDEKTQLPIDVEIVYTFNSKRCSIANSWIEIEELNIL